VSAAVDLKRRTGVEDDCGHGTERDWRPTVVAYFKAISRDSSE
jgi:hypothetical protein